MKIRCIALLLSLFVIAFPGYSAPASQAPSKNPPVVKNVQSAKIDLNKADLTTLTGSFKGIGKKRAEAIVAYREAHTRFNSVEELAEVKGIGKNFVAKHKEKLEAVFMVG